MGTFKKSFEQWCNENGMEIYLKYWDYEINGFTPSEIGHSSCVEAAFKCDNPDHPIFYKRLNDISDSRHKNTFVCPACSSIGQYIIDTKGKEYMDAIWSDKNEKSYYEFSKRSKKEIWLKCLSNDHHPDYKVPANTLYIGCGCPYCSGNKVCYENSLAKSIPEIKDVWSDKNGKMPDEYTANSRKKVWLKCAENKHEDFQRQVGNIQTYGYECPKCVSARQGELQRDDLTGRTFGRLTVLGVDPDDDKRNGIRYICQCSCENHTIKSVLGSHLTSGKIQSCGCLWHEKISGENNWLWKGGVSSYNKEGRNTLDYDRWHAQVLEDDCYTCQCCGASTDLEVHHIYNYSEYPDLRYDTANGITLCKQCHAQRIPGSFHRIYGTSNNTPEQLEEYINNKRVEIGIDEKFSADDYINFSQNLKDRSNERTCICCGRTYNYMPYFNPYKRLPMWKEKFDSQTCKNIYDIVSDYQSGAISRELAKQKLSDFDLGDMTFVDDIQSTIDEIFETTENNGFEKIVYRPGRGVPEKMVANLF